MKPYQPGLVSFIIPTLPRNKFQSLKTLVKTRYLWDECVRDLKANVSLPNEVILVINGDEDVDFVAKAKSHKAVDKYLIASQNTGVPRGWNLGAHMAEGEYLCFVNDDVEVGPQAIERLVEVLNQPGVGEVGPAGTGWYKKTPGPHVGMEKIEPADNISGFLFLVKREVYDQVGGFDDAYTPALMEEIDFSFAVRDQGLSCLVVPGLDIQHHHIGGASSTNKPFVCLGREYWREEVTARNQEYFEQKWQKFWKD